MSPESDEEISEAVVVIIAGADPLPPSGECNAGFLSDVGESAVAIIVIEVAGGFLGLGEAFEGVAVDKENVGPAVVVIVDDGGASAGAFYDVLFDAFAAVFGASGEAGLGGDVYEMDLGGLRWSGLRNCGDGGSLLCGGVNSEMKPPRKKQRERDYYSDGADGHLAPAGVARNCVRAMGQESLHRA